MGNIYAVIGSQYGHEGKGDVVACLSKGCELNVRCGKPGMTKTTYWQGNKYTTEFIPSGWQHEDTVLCIGKGTRLNPAVFYEELQYLSKFDANLRHRIIIDGSCTLYHSFTMVKDFEPFVNFCKDRDIEIVDNTTSLIISAAKQGEVIIEGEGGFELSPYNGNGVVESAYDTTINTLSSEVGIPLSLLTVLMVVRARAVSNERKVIDFDAQSLSRAVFVNRPNAFIATYLDYISPRDRDVNEYDKLHPSSIAFVDYLEGLWQIPVAYLGTGRGVLMANKDTSKNRRKSTNAKTDRSGANKCGK
ncbi:MAG: hypothetical protein HF312_15520 [Ignavibacteria bacterium]|jgi:adenylosuccinate synthase|nr:hypothetical protein [Ignavibacteria bacterium]